MKRGFFVSLFAVLFTLSFASAYVGECDLDVSLLNQDPIHAVPGEYVKVIFQIDGVENPDCKTVNFEFVQEYPFSLDPGVSGSRTIQSGTFTNSYNSQATIPFSVRVDKDALDKYYEMKVRYSTDRTGGAIEIEKSFNISVEDVKTDFDVFVDDFQAGTNTITFNILNIGKNDVEALTVEVPKQDNLVVKGSNKAIVGTLDSNQDTTFTYEATPTEGEIKVLINYNDENGDRRTIEKSVVYDSSYFTGRAGETKSSSPVWKWIVILAILFYLGRWIKGKFFAKKENKR